ncbi:YopX family protein [Bacillus sp. FSL W8-0940]|uniref:YopX family protein n=1 Tax=Bacillus sp. FSL W8-0940 TaxID=2954638 RepID=UPI0030F82E4B
MREIKFRGKPIEDYGDIKWFYGGIDLNHDDKLAYISTPYNGHVPVEWESIGQYTGLKDKHIRDVYEGDIRKDVWGRKFKVVYDNDLAAFYGEYINGPSESLADCGPDSEYLGTVFENPDLLEAASANKEEL